MSHNTLENYYKSIASLTFYHKYSIKDIENMYPFERDMYIDLIIQFLEEKNKE